MDNRITPPVYSQIALDIALRISRGELKENTKVHGRSIMASQYGVSPETIRRAMKLLEDMRVVEIKQNSGVTIVSAENAARYVEKFGAQNDIRDHQRKLKQLLKEQELLAQKIMEQAGSIIRINEIFSQTNPFNNYEIDIPPDSPLLGKTLGELKFWQETAATVIAIRRGDKIILSPGPYATINADDTLIFVGDLACIAAVEAFVKP
ncbi:MAG: TrkA C-terminal domain-containing protein [Oscillospiraceae bacterium]